MKFISIDIETTGLDPEQHQILEIGAVCWDGGQIGKPFQCYVKHGPIIGDPFALQMNQGILKELADGKGILPNEVFALFAIWRQDLGFSSPYNAAGKNFASFDAMFLKKLPHFFYKNKWRHRILDPAMLYYRAEDTSLPNMETCLQRAGMADQVSHRAVDDAIQVAQLLEAAL